MLSKETDTSLIISGLQLRIILIIDYHIDSQINLLCNKMSENNANNAHHESLKLKVVPSDCLFFLTSSPKPKDIQITMNILLL